MKSAWYFNRYILLVIAIIFCSLSFVASYMLDSFHENLFSSSGAVITVLGLFLNIKHTLLFHLKIPLKNKYNIHTGAMRFGSKDFTEEQKEKINNVLSDEKYGVSFMVIGTLIWAYGTYLIQYAKSI